MFPRSRKKFVAMMALVAIVFAALMPASSAWARAWANADVVALGGICATAAGDEAGAPALPSGSSAAHGHCAFCTLGAPLVMAMRFDTLLARVDAPASIRHTHRSDALPRDSVAIHPLSPRAPPRAS